VVDHKEVRIPDGIIVIIQNLYEEGQSSVKWNGAIGEWFTVMTGVRQGCILSPLLFALIMDWIMKTALSDLDVGLEWIHGSRLCDLDYADDIVLLDSSHERMQKMTTAVEHRRGKLGLHMNVDKCKIVISNDWVDDTEIQTGNAAIDTTEEFCYLGSYVTSDSSCDKD